MTTPPTDFARAKRRKLAEETNEFTTPLQMLELAKDRLTEHGGITNALVILDQPDGALLVLSAGVTYAQANYLLDQAKLMMLLDK